MPVSDRQIDLTNGATSDENSPPQFKPAYNIEQGYKDAVNQWTTNSDSNSKLVTITIDTSKRAEQSWEDSGFSKTSVQVSGRYWFASARTTVINVDKEEHISLDQLGSGLSLNLRAAGVKSFNVTPGSWYVET